VLALPPAAHKAGRKTGKARLIGLPAVSQAIIANQTAGGSESYVFAPASGKGPVNVSKLAVAIIGAIVAGFQPHGMARAFVATAVVQVLVPVVALSRGRSPQGRSGH
jgi:hypothetical protein